MNPDLQISVPIWALEALVNVALDHGRTAGLAGDAIIVVNNAIVTAIVGPCRMPS